MSELKQKLQILMQQKKPLVVTGSIIFAIVLLIIASTLINPPSREIAWRDFSGSTLGFAISHPEGWTVEEEDALSGPDILVSDTNGFAFVRIRGFLDPAIFNDQGAIAASVAEYKKAMLSQDDVMLRDFREESEGFFATGEFPINDTMYRFEERGQIFSALGQVIIMRAADTPEHFDSSIGVMRKIMESFKQE